MKSIAIREIMDLSIRRSENNMILLYEVLEWYINNHSKNMFSLSAKKQSSIIYSEYFDEIIENKDATKEDFLNILSIIKNDLQIETPEIPLGFDALVDLVNLTNEEKDILYFYYKYSLLSYDAQNRIDFMLMNSPSGTVSAICELINIDQRKYKKLISQNSTLRITGLIEKYESDNQHLYFIPDKFMHAINFSSNGDDLENYLFPSVDFNTELTFDDFQDNFALNVSKIVETAFEKQEENNFTLGMNFLFWGLPGTGKTQLVNILAKQNGWDLRVIGEENLFNIENSNSSHLERFQSLVLANKIYRNSKKKVILLFDEFEDILSDKNKLSQAFVNKILETMPRPTFFTANAIWRHPPAWLRRFTFACEFKHPNYKNRLKVWKKQAQKYSWNIDKKNLELLANEFVLTPALIEHVSKSAYLLGSNIDDIKKLIKETLKASQGGYYENKFYNDPKEINFDFINCATDIKSFVDRIYETNDPFTILISGPPGTGKTEFANYLARKMGKKVIEKNAANMTSAYLGETEKLIDSAFEEAFENDGLLLLNEGDSFLQNRDNAKHSWELTQTNQMLQNLEHSKIPVVFTTNLPKTLDKASKRRFTFDLYFDFPTDEQQKEMFKYFFGIDFNGNWKYKATPGDFAVISKKCKFLKLNSFEDIMKEFDIYFELESQNKIGF